MPDPPVRVKRNVSVLAEAFCLAREPIPVDPDTGTTLVLLGLERSNCLLRRDRGVYVRLPSPVNHSRRELV